MAFRIGNHRNGTPWDIDYDIGFGQHGGDASAEFPYKYTITGPTHESNSANTYYPCSFYAHGFRSPSAGPNLLITRFYGETGPAQNGGSSIGWTGSSSHQGGLYAAFRIGDSAWSDMHERQLYRLRYTYHNTIANIGMNLTVNTGSPRGSGPFWVMLRGGFKYIIYAKMPVNPVWVTPGGPCVNYGGNPNYQEWPNTTTTVSAPYNAGYYGDSNVD